MTRQEKDTTVHTHETPASTEMPAAGTVAREHERVEGPVTWEEMRALMRGGVPSQMVTRTWRPTTGGLLSIVAGSWNFILGLGAIVSGTFLSDLIPTIGGITGGINTGSIAAGIVLLVFGIISIVGGVFALSRTMWPIALAGAILALIPTPLILPFIAGFFALVFIVLGHREFWAKERGEID